MRFHFIRLVALCLIASPFLAAPGCDDADAANRLMVANQLKKAADNAFLAHSPADLNKVTLELQAIKGGSDKQMATRDRLLASIQMHEAVLVMDDIEKVEIGLRHDLVRLRAMAFASERLATFSSAREKVSGPINTPQLNERREQIRAQAEQLRSQAQQIEEPVLESIESLRESDEEVLKLHRQANRLRDEAAMADPVNRFEIIEQAIELERQADRIESEMMRQELSLELVQQPAKEMMDRSQNDLEEMLAEIDAAQDDLQTLSRQMAESGAKGRVSLKEMEGKITDLSKDMSDRFNDLQLGYQSAEKKLESAAVFARKGGRKTEGKLAKETQTRLLAQIQLAQADLGLMQVRGLDEWIRILTTLSMNDDLGNRDAWKLQAEEATKRREAIVKKTVGFIDQSLQSGAKSDLIEETRTNLEATKAFLAGETIESTKRVVADPKKSPPPAAASPAPVTDSGSDNEGGYPTVEALVAALNSAIRNLSVANASIIDNATYSSNPSDMDSAVDTVRFAKLMDDINKAAQSKSLKVEGPLGMVMQATGGMLKMMKGMQFSDPVAAGDQGMVQVSMSIMGQTHKEPMPVIKVNGLWYINMDKDGAFITGKDGDSKRLLPIAERILKEIKSGDISSQSELNNAMKPFNATIMKGM